MALTRKFLTALGIEPEKIDEIITAHTETVDALKAERDKFRSDAEKLPGVQKELNEMKKASEEMEGSNPYEARYNELKKQYDSYKADVEAKELLARKEAAYRALLKAAGVSDKRIDSILKVTDLSKEELDRDGNFKNKDALEEAIRTEWADFIVTEVTKGAAVTHPGGSNNGAGSMTKAEIMKIRDTTARQRAIAENIELFHK